MSELFLQALLAHLVADWFLQNEWQQNKVNLSHPAAWVHSGLHFAALLFVFTWPVALGVAASHLLIDTRKPLQWWRRLTGQMKGHSPSEPLYTAFAMWQDQAVHICILLVVVLAGAK